MENQDKLYTILGKMFIHYCAVKGIPISAKHFSNMIPELEKCFGASPDELKDAYRLLTSESNELGFQQTEKTAVIGFKKFE